MQKVLILFVLMCSVSVISGEIFRHGISAEKKPWTHERFLNDSNEFSFVIIPDRTGAERRGIFPEAVRKANLFRPEFIMTVGDLIQGQMDRRYQDHEYLRKQWRELTDMTSKSEAPFFYLVGNHDIARTRTGFPRSNETSKEVWEEFLGERTYYCFVYKKVLFICLNTMEGRDARPKQVGITESQLRWAEGVLKKYHDVRWTFVFLHQPGVVNSKPFLRLEKSLKKRQYTVFAGDWHRYCKFQRYGRNYYVLATAGGGSKLRGIPYGEFDHITYVTVTDKGPVIANILLDGILDDDAVTAENIQEKNRNYQNLNLPDAAQGTDKKASDR